MVSYDTEQFEVVIMQEGKPFDGYEFSYITGTHYMPGYWELTPDNHNYYLTLSDVDNFATTHQMHRTSSSTYGQPQRVKMAQCQWVSICST